MRARIASSRRRGTAGIRVTIERAARRRLSRGVLAILAGAVLAVAQSKLDIMERRGPLFESRVAPTAQGDRIAGEGGVDSSGTHDPLDPFSADPGPEASLSPGSRRHPGGDHGAHPVAEAVGGVSQQVQQPVASREGRTEARVGPGVRLRITHRRREDWRIAVESTSGPRRSVATPSLLICSYQWTLGQGGGPLFPGRRRTETGVISSYRAALKVGAVVASGDQRPRR